MKRLLSSIIQIPLLLIPLTISVAQSTKGMIMNEIGGGTYIRKKFDSDDRLKDFDVFKIGKLIQEDNTYVLPIAIYSYDQAGKFIDSTHTSYKCKPGVKGMLVAIFLHAGKYSENSVNITQTSSSQLYPDRLQSAISSLDDASFDLKIEGGFAGFFGARGKVLLSERQAKPITATQYSFTGKLTIKSYVLGLNISTSQFTLTETLDTLKGIIYQKFTGTEGDYFTMELKQ